MRIAVRLRYLGGYTTAYHFVCVHSCLLNNVLTLIFSNSAGKLDQSQVQQRDVLPGHIIGEDPPADGVRASSLIHGYSRRTPAVAGVITTNYLLGGHSVRVSQLIFPIQKWNLEKVVIRENVRKLLF